MILLAYWLAFWLPSARAAVLLVGCGAPVLTFAAMILATFKDESWFDAANTPLCLLPPYFLTSTLYFSALLALAPAVPHARWLPVALIPSLMILAHA